MTINVVWLHMKIILLIVKGGIEGGKSRIQQFAAIKI